MIENARPVNPVDPEAVIDEIDIDPEAVSDEIDIDPEAPADAPAMIDDDEPVDDD